MDSKATLNPVDRSNRIALQRAVRSFRVPLAAGALVLVTGICACASGTTNSRNRIGDAARTFTTSIEAGTSFQNDFFWYFDEAHNLLQRFDFAEQKPTVRLERRSADLEWPSPALASDATGKILIEMSEKSLIIHRPDGSFEKDPVRLVGSPVSAAIDPVSRFFVFYDAFANVGSLKLDEQGNVEGRFAGGSQLGEGVTILSGDLDDKGNLYLFLSNGALQRTSLENLFAAQTWTGESIWIPELAGKKLEWLAPLPSSTWIIGLTSRTVGQSSEVVLLNAGALYARDELKTPPSEAADPETLERGSSGEAVQTAAISSSNVGVHPSRGLLPHILYTLTATSSGSASASSGFPMLPLRIIAPRRPDPAVDTWILEDVMGARLLDLPAEVFTQPTRTVSAGSLAPALAISLSAYDQAAGELSLLFTATASSAATVSGAQSYGSTGVKETRRFIRVRLADLFVKHSVAADFSRHASFNGDWVFGWEGNALGYVRGEPLQGQPPFESSGFMLDAVLADQNPK